MERQRAAGTAARAVDGLGVARALGKRGRRERLVARMEGEGRSLAGSRRVSTRSKQIGSGRPSGTTLSLHGGLARAPSLPVGARLPSHGQIELPAGRGGVPGWVSEPLAGRGRDASPPRNSGRARSIKGDKPEHGKRSSISGRCGSQRSQGPQTGSEGLVHASGPGSSPHFCAALA